MNQDSISLRLIAIAIIGGGCFVASLLVMGLVAERQDTLSEARKEIASKWGERQTVTGPMIVADIMSGEIPTHAYILPETVKIQSALTPEKRSRGIFDVIVYTSTIEISGEFSPQEIAQAGMGARTAVFSLPITDTRGVEKQFELTWDGAKYAFEPGPGAGFREGSGLHARVPVRGGTERIPFSLEFHTKGSEGISFAPVGKETVLTVSSPWESPKFTGAFLPSQRDINTSGFQAEWRISSFGRSFPQTWVGNHVSPEQINASAFGVDLHPGVDAYDMTFRSVKYAILFIVITFSVFFLFDILAKVRVHPIQYLLIGSALALFYILLLSLAEQVGFLPAYIAATVLITLLVTLYSAYVLRSNARAVPIAVILAALYGYLYFVLQLEDYALLFGSLLLFILLGTVMYLTRNVDWYVLGASPSPGETRE